jgi:hypothetical protein
VIDAIALRVVRRFLADQPSGARREVRKNTKPINPPKGIDRSLVRDNAKSESPGPQETPTPNRRDVQPKDVFHSTPRHINVRNLAETGKDQAKAIEKQIPKDKGYDVVRNLSQYLIRTDGGSEGGPEGKPT